MNFHRLINTLAKLEAYLEEHGAQNIRTDCTGSYFLFPGDKGYIALKK